MKYFENLKLAYNEMTENEQQELHKKVAKLLIGIIFIIFGILAELNLFGEATKIFVDMIFWISLIVILPFSTATLLDFLF